MFAFRFHQFPFRFCFKLLFSGSKGFCLWRWEFTKKVPKVARSSSHSNILEFNKIEYLGPLNEEASTSSSWSSEVHGPPSPHPCQETCTCCFPQRSLFPGPTSSSFSLGLKVSPMKEMGPSTKACNK